MNWKILSALLAAQIALSVIIWTSGRFDPEDGETFFALEDDEVRAVEIEDEDGTLVLRRSGTDASGEAGWWLPNEIPAKSSKVREMLDNLVKAGESNWPVATTGSAATRFEVTPDNYQRYIKLTDAEDEVIKELYLGTSPTFGKVHVRLADEDTIYAVNFSNHEASVDGSDWLDKALLRPTGKLQSVTRLGREGGYRLAKTDGAWAIEGDQAALDQDKTTTFVNRFAQLNALKLLDEAPGKDDTPASSFRLVDASGSYELAFYNPEDEDGNMMVVSDKYEAAFEIASYLNDLIDKSVETLKVPIVEEQEEPPQEEAQEEPKDG